MFNSYKKFLILFLLIIIFQSSLVLGTKGWFGDGVNLTLANLLFLDTSSMFVGIGTLIPNQKLEVNGNVNVSGTVYASAFSSNSPLQLQTLGVTRLYVDDITGKVGIGTSNPSQALDVAGNVNATGNMSVSDSVCLSNDCRSSWTSSSGGGCELVAAIPGNIPSAITIPSRCIPGGCQIVIEHNTYIGSETYVYYSGNSWFSTNGNSETNGDSSGSIIVSVSHMTIYDDSPGIETSPSQWSMSCSLPPTCYVWAC